MAMHGRLVRSGALALAIACCATPALAHEVEAPKRYNEVDLQADVSREVQNDQLNATLYAELSDANPAELANALNRIANEALKTAAEFKTVKLTTGYNQSYPVYDRNNRMTGWRGRTELRMESKDFPAAAKLIGKLQSTLQLGGITFGVSPELRRQTEQTLMKDVVLAFRERADVLTQALGGKTYRLRKIAVQSTEGVAPPRPMYSARKDMSEAASVAPDLQGGTSQVQVGAVGTIEVE